MKDPHAIILKPHITEKSAKMSYGDDPVNEEKSRRTYTFIVAPTANKIEIKEAIESIYNAGKRDKDARITVSSVRTVSGKGKMGRRVGNRPRGKKKDFKKAVVTLAAGQMLEDYGV
jgi:large subunit ribosomal protein L23